MEILSESSDVLVAQNNRKQAKCAVTKLANQLKVSLVLEPEKKFDFQKLDKYSIQIDAENLEHKLKALEDANQKYHSVSKACLESNGAKENVFDQLEDTLGIISSPISRL